jgi:glycosyltransferase involved in cell wall biosynthesis
MSQIKVTVGIPVYNSENHISICLNSILNQSMEQESIEIIAVNDGSTDRSGAVLDSYARAHSNITVIHQENTGGPGAPRNTIMGHASGEFIFFVDADDYLGTEALERMYRMGTANHSDIIVGKFTGVNGRWVAKSMFAANVPSASLYDSNLLESIGPTKMFRRRFLLENDISFPMGICTAEDQPFMVMAYILARGISIVADYPCYYVVNHNDKEHASMIKVEPRDYYKPLEESVKVIHRYAEDEEKRSLLKAKYLKKELTTGRSILFAGSQMCLDEKVRWLSELNLFLSSWVDDKTEKLLPLNMRAFLFLVKRGDLERLKRLSGLEIVQASGEEAALF